MFWIFPYKTVKHTQIKHDSFMFEDCFTNIQVEEFPSSLFMAIALDKRKNK